MNPGCLWATGIPAIFCFFWVVLGTGLETETLYTIPLLSPSPHYGWLCLICLRFFYLSAISVPWFSDIEGQTHTPMVS